MLFLPANIVLAARKAFSLASKKKKSPTKFQEKPSFLLSPKWCIFEITNMVMAIFVKIEF
ncbi:MAG: hypothetical protein CVU03_00820 [Bacteroidetes bacterium HGW-Bacteroidetes-2]|nr:MAG: hypothetical protein CVU03_00820 [Bacteroidetes bacterium HGW-Bacteroidetes-2]